MTPPKLSKFQSSTRLTAFATFVVPAGATWVFPVSILYEADGLCDDEERMALEAQRAAFQSSTRLTAFATKLSNIRLVRALGFQSSTRLTAFATRA